MLSWQKNLWSKVHLVLVTAGLSPSLYNTPIVVRRHKKAMQFVLFVMKRIALCAHVRGVAY